jgi:hypothetical protein
VIPDVTSIWQRVQKRKKGVAALFLVGGLAMPGARRKAIGLRPRCSMLGGAEVGSVKLNGDTGGVRIRAEVSGLPAGFHAFHIHAVGTCTPPFATAGGHRNPEGQTHPSHAGDQPVSWSMPMEQDPCPSSRIGTGSRPCSTRTGCVHRPREPRQLRQRVPLRDARRHHTCHG